MERVAVEITLAVVALLASAGVLRLLVSRRHHVPRLAVEASNQFREIDIRAFENLLDPSENEYLKRNLPPHIYRAVQRRRIVAALAYLAEVRENAALLLRHAGRMRAADASSSGAADHLAAAAVQFETLCFKARLRLYALWVVPGVPHFGTTLADRYEGLRFQFKQVATVRPSPLSRVS